MQNNIQEDIYAGNSISVASADVFFNFLGVPDGLAAVSLSAKLRLESRESGGPPGR